MGDDKSASDSELPEKEASAYLASGFLVGGGRFTLLSELGRGGMGLVWLARDERLATPVALKFLSEKVRENPAALTDLRQETHRSRMLSHPNILRIYDLYEAPDESPFISMEYFEGASLWTLLHRQPGTFFRWDYLAPVVRQLCEALAYAHSENVIHRDLKPSNMLLDEERMRLRLADFGIAAWAFNSSVVESGSRNTTGTLVYMSPQQIDGQPPAVTDDIYALGATLYELLSGRPPFYENDIAYQVRNVLPTPLDERLADLEIENEVPPAVAAMIMACLAKDPEKRPQSARAVADWIGFHETGGAPMAHFAPATPAVPVATPPARESKKTTVAPAVVPVDVNQVTPVEQHPLRRNFAMLIGSLGIGLVAWLAWSHFIPKMPPVETAPLAEETNTAAPVVTNTASAAPPAQPVAPVELGGNVSVIFGAVDRERGLRELIALHQPQTSAATIGGKECRLLRFNGKRARADFAILPPNKRSKPMNARVEVEYYAEAPGAMQILFDGSSRPAPHFSNGGRVDFEAGGGWKTADFQLNDAVFHNGQLGGGDFRIVTSSHELYIRSVTLYFDE